ncbi:MAG: zinc ribbon domain-containing protein [Oscillospiraceae bacterium]|nr:zinc ribbon domain-containing protein [Oscillospiraceae bacterium]
MFCPKCGFENLADAQFCTKCGTPLVTQAAHGGYAHPAPPSFFGDVYAKAFTGFLFKKPIMLWGISLLSTLLTLLAILFSAGIPIIWIPIVLVLQIGLCNVFLRGFRGQQINANLLFEGFKKDVFFRNAGGMAWTELWLLIWLLIPFAGLVFVFIKYYSYRFVPFIMLEDPDISAADALKKSMTMTHGYRGKMFAADIVIIAGAIVLTLIFVLIALVPFLRILLFLYIIVLAALLPLILYTLGAVYYDKVSKLNAM